MTSFVKNKFLIFSKGVNVKILESLYLLKSQWIVLMWLTDFTCSELHNLWMGLLSKFKMTARLAY